MTRVDWQLVQESDFEVPADPPLSDLTADLTALIGDADPVRRDELALPVLSTWIHRGVYDDLLPGLGDGMAVGLSVGLGEHDTDTVFRRSVSALVLARCIERDNQRPLVMGGKVLEWGDRLASWLLAEQDLRGFVPGKGWARAVACGADAIGALARSPHFGAAELTVLLDVIGERVSAPVPPVFGDGECEHLASATLDVLRRDHVPFDIVEAWLGSLVDDAVRATAPSQVGDYLRALYVHLTLGTEPPPARADLVLVVVEALRTLSPQLRGETAGFGDSTSL